MRGGLDGAHLCTVQSVLLWCPCPAYRLWSSAGTGRHRSRHRSHTPAPQWQRWKEGRWAHILNPCGALKLLFLWCWKLVNYLFLKNSLFERPTLDLFFSSQSGEGHSQWAWPFTSTHEAPNIHNTLSQEIGASGPVAKMGFCWYCRVKLSSYSL